MTQGNIYHTGSDKINVEFYMRAALHGDAVAQCYLGIMYEKGMGVPMDRHKAAKWYRHAAEQGYPDAQASLEILYSGALLHHQLTHSKPVTN
ncbi:MAG: sel1 repeat family protein [Gammaproteobacteria bacterium]|nr:sel1 repeat family protein [Gammaproteobacteria bacterium]